MLNKILLSLYLIVGAMMVVAMLLYSLDSELEIMENQDKKHFEHIEREGKSERNI